MDCGKSCWFALIQQLTLRITSDWKIQPNHDYSLTVFASVAQSQMMPFVDVGVYRLCEMRPEVATFPPTSALRQWRSRSSSSVKVNLLSGCDKITRELLFLLVVRPYRVCSDHCEIC